MHILHITNSYGGTEVYTNLYRSIDQENIIQTVFVPLNPNNHDRVGNKPINFASKESDIIYSTKLKGYHRYFYGLKISTIVSEIIKQVDMTKVDLIHASMLCLDGGVAYELHKKFKIPYMVAVRTTDVTAYYKKLSWRHGYFGKILQHASKIIFISPKYKENFVKEQVPASVRDQVESKMMVVPNGVNQVYLDHINLDTHELGENIKMIFVAAFYKGKGLIETILAIEQLRQKGYHIELNAIGKGLPNRPRDEEYIKAVEQVTEGKEWVKLQPFKKPEEIIKEMRESNIFVMVSSPETFGLVYVEALTQNLPIIYAKNQGFDGFFPDGFVGYPAKAGDIDDIQNSIEGVINNYKQISSNIITVDLHKDFDWAAIGDKYRKIYSEILK